MGHNRSHGTGDLWTAQHGWAGAIHAVSPFFWDQRVFILFPNFICISYLKNVFISSFLFLPGEGLVSVRHSHHIQYLTISPSLDLSGIKATHTPPNPQVCSLMLFISILACSQTYDFHLLTQRLGLGECVMCLSNFLEGDSNIYPGVGNHSHNVRGHGLRD